MLTLSILALAIAVWALARTFSRPKRPRVHLGGPPAPERRDDRSPHQS